MLNIFEDTDLDLYPAKDPAVIAAQAVLQAARDEAEPAQQAWRAYVIEHCDEAVSIPFSRQRQHLYDQVLDTSEAVTAAETAYAVALDAATQRAKDGWDAMVREQFLADLPTIESFITLLEKHEQTVIEAQLAGVSHILSVPVTFVTAGEVATRLAYAKKELGVED